MPTNPRIVDADLRQALARLLNSARNGAHYGDPFYAGYYHGLRMMTEHIQFERKIQQDARYWQRLDRRQLRSRKAEEIRRSQNNEHRCAEVGL